MIDIAQDVLVHAPPGSVCPVISDPRAVVECIPGATLIEMDGSVFKGTIAVKFGPMRAQFSGSGTCEFDEPAQTGSITGRGRDSRGATKFQATVGFCLTPAPEGARIAVTGGMDLPGPLASVVETGAQSVVEEITSEFARRLGARCDDVAPDPAESSALVPAASRRKLRPRLAAPILAAPRRSRSWSS